MTQLLQLLEPNTPRTDEGDPPEKWVGIDLGTTHSLVCHYDNGEVVFFKDSRGRHIFPSVVTYTKEGEMVSIGDLDDAEGYVAVHSIKRRLGRGTMVCDEKNDNAFFSGEAHVRVGRKSISPIMISAEILNFLKLIAEDNCDTEINNAVITVPAYFDEVARMATRKAAEYAGFQEIILLSEPTAAALAFGLRTDKPGLYGVYDLGGGTFDFSLLRCEHGFFHVLATVGDTDLGGDDFDAAIASYLGEHGLTFETRAEAITQARRVKHDLSQADEASITVDEKTVRITRGDFDEMIRAHVTRTLTLCSHALADADVTWDDLSGVLLVGGSTRVQLVAHALKEHARCPILTDLDPDEAVAQGAAVRAHQVSHKDSHQGGMSLADVTPLSLGVETLGGVVERIIARNTPIPVSDWREFTTFKDDQDAISLHITQGERELAADCRSLGKFSLRGIPPMKAGEARIRVRFTLDADGVLSVEAFEKTTGKRQSVELNPTYGIDGEVIEGMVRQSLQHANVDMENRFMIQVRQKAETLLATGMALMNALEDKTPDLHDALTALEEAATHTDRAHIRGAINRVETLMQPLVEAQFNAHLNKATNAGKKTALDSDELDAKVPENNH